ncbi:hypothetical protein ACRXCV_06680 [Halobacteriovorax sp. GFR7]|uniref:hypothetical protein n=1 Tax=unclassified Halobacteriovorax TaxID=2639665 RepID=UPI003D979FCD
MKDSINEINIKTKLKSKATINPPKEMKAAFKTKFEDHLKLKQKKKKQWLSIALASATFCLALILFLNVNQSSSTTSNVKDYLAYIESNFSNDDHVLESLDEVNTLSYNDIDTEYSDY